MSAIPSQNPIAVEAVSSPRLHRPEGDDHSTFRHQRPPASRHTRTSWFSRQAVRLAGRVGRLGLPLAALIPFCLSLWHSAPPAPRAKTQRPLRSLVFTQYLVNLGSVPVRPQHVARFVFFNAGNHPVKIKKLEPSCGCLSPRLEKKVYQPGETGSFFLTVRTANEAPGPKQYTCRVLYEDPKPGEIELTFKLVLPKRSVTIRPRSLIVYAFSDQPVSKDFVVTDTRSTPLRIVGCRSTIPFVSVRVEPPKQNTTGARIQKVTVRAESVPVGVHRGVIVLTTDDPDYPQIAVPLWIERPERPVLPTARDLSDAP